ncbi:hypothetical protein CATMIT_01589, partial [Catenibacterium mitsuokai DSM 15897]
GRLRQARQEPAVGPRAHTADPGLTPCGMAGPRGRQRRSLDEPPHWYFTDA